MRGRLVVAATTPRAPDIAVGDERPGPLTDSPGGSVRCRRPRAWRIARTNAACPTATPGGTPTDTPSPPAIFGTDPPATTVTAGVALNDRSDAERLDRRRGGVGGGAGRARGGRVRRSAARPCGCSRDRPQPRAPPPTR